MEQTKTAYEAQLKIVEIIKHFQEVCAQMGPQTGKLMASIDNVGMMDILFLWQRTKSENKRLFMPGELDNNFITIIYKPAENCIIEIESEPVFKPSTKIPNCRLN